MKQIGCDMCDNEHPLVFEGTGGSLVAISYMYSCDQARHPFDTDGERVLKTDMKAAFCKNWIASNGAKGDVFRQRATLS